VCFVHFDTKSRVCVRRVFFGVIEEIPENKANPNGFDELIFWSVPF
jgi:hypothetical protein